MAFVDFLDPAPRHVPSASNDTGPRLNYRPPAAAGTGAAEVGEGATPGAEGAGLFELRSARGEGSRLRPTRGAGSSPGRGTSPATRHPQQALPPRTHTQQQHQQQQLQGAKGQEGQNDVSPRSVLESLVTSGQPGPGSGSGAGEMQLQRACGASSPAPLSPARCTASAAASLALSPTSSAGPSSPLHPSLRAIPKRLMHLEGSPLQRSFERSCNRSRSSLGGGSSGGTGDSSDSSGDSASKELFGAAGAEDVANDEALGAFLAATNAAARSRRQRQAEEPRSQQFLSAQPGQARRGRRTSCESAVCETRPWVEALQGTGDMVAKRAAAKAIWMALKDGPENRMRLVGAGGVWPLILALSSSDADTAEHAAAALIFLCMSPDSAREVLSCGGLRSLVALLSSPSAAEATKSNVAAALFALTHSEEQRRLAHAAKALPPLVCLLKGARSARAKKDACLVLYNMAMLAGVPEELVAQGVLRRLVELLEEAEEGVEEKVAALLGGLSKTDAGLRALLADDDVLPAVAGTLEGGSKSAAEHAATCLCQLAMANPGMVPKIMAEGCLPPLVRVASQSKKGSDARVILDIMRRYGTKKAKEEADARDALHKKMAALRRDSPQRSPSRLGASMSFNAFRRSSFSIDRDTLERAWSGERK